MAKIDGIHADNPAYGARKIARQLRKDGEDVTRWHVTSLMHEMNIRPCCPLPSLSKPSKRSKRFPYLLKGKKILFPNQVWSTDITYVQIGGHHMYLTAVIDRAFAEHGTPSVMNSDQGSVFGSDVYVSLLASNRVTQSMDGRARWRDNVLMERWFRTLKSEWLRTHEYSTPKELGRLVAEFVGYYNDARIHQSLGYDTPASWYYAGINERVA